MPNFLSNLTIIQKDRLKQLRERQNGYYDLQFIKAMPPEMRNRCIDLLEESRSQLRQDLFALAQSGFKTGGYFVEFGATDGIELNNSYLMETRFGWSGILAEPARGWHEALRANRKAMVDTRCVWRSSGETLEFTEAPRGEVSGLTTFMTRSRKLRWPSYEVETVSLNDLLAQHGAPRDIDYMSVDTEGSEFDILNALDFDRWAPRVMTVEHNFAPQREKIHRLLTSRGYTRVLEPISRFDDWYIRES